MAIPGSNIEEFGMTTRRIETLSDGIFAISMTLLVLSLELPGAKEGVRATGLYDILASQINKFFNYARSFILLAVFWFMHHRQFHFIKKTNWVHLWINIFILLFIALIPFSTSLVSDYPRDYVAELFFGSNLFILGILFSCSWIYATSGHRLVDRKLDMRYITLGKERSMIISLICLLAMGLSLFNPSLSSKIYLLIPVILFFTMSKHELK